MRVAVVKENIITNVIVSSAPDGKTTFELPIGKWIGDYYIDPPATTEERVAELEEAMELLLSGATGEEVTADET